jgi:hypothetical protein
MAYGIQIFNANGNTQIDSSTTNLGITVLDAAASSQTCTADLTYDLVFAKPVATSGTQTIAMDTSGNNTSSSTWTFRNHTGTAINASYIVARASSGQTASSSGYGLQVYNTDGDLAFDSGLYNGDAGLGITHFIPGWSINGNYNFIDGDLSQYSLMNPTNPGSSSTWFYGYIYRHTTGTASPYTSGPGIYYLGFFTIMGQSYFLPNLGCIFLGEGGSV